MLRTYLPAICACLCLASAPGRADVGTLQFDTGVPSAAATTGSPAVPDLSFGNRFDAGIGLNGTSESVLATGTVSRVSFYLAGFDPPFVYLTVFGPVNGTTAQPLRTVNVTDAALGWNVHTFATPVPYTGASFLVGVWTRNRSTTAATEDAVALDTATHLGQGHHGFAIQDVVGTGFTPLPANALIRASGDFLPPELLFDVQASAQLGDALWVDADLSGTVSAGDTLRYTAALANGGSEDAPVARFEADPDPRTPLVPGSVVTSLGSVTRGNAPGDPRVEVELGALAAGAAASVTWDAALPDPLPAGTTQLESQGRLSGMGFAALASDDPDTAAPADATVTPVDDPTASFGPEARLRPRVKLVFDRVGADAVKLQVKRWEIPGGFAAPGNAVRVDVGGVVFDATLDAKGRSRGVNHKLKVKRRLRDDTWKLSFRWRSGDWAADLADEGLVDGDLRDEPVSVEVRVVADGVVYRQDVALSWSCRAGRKGRARLP